MAGLALVDLALPTGGEIDLEAVSTHLHRQVSLQRMTANKQRPARATSRPSATRRDGASQARSRASTPASWSGRRTPATENAAAARRSPKTVPMVAPCAGEAASSAAAKAA